MLVVVEFEDRTRCLLFSEVRVDCRLLFRQTQASQFASGSGEERREVGFAPPQVRTGKDHVGLGRHAEWQAREDRKGREEGRSWSSTSCRSWGRGLRSRRDHRSRVLRSRGRGEPRVRIHPYLQRSPERSLRPANQSQLSSPTQLSSIKQNQGPRLHRRLSARLQLLQNEGGNSEET